MKRILIVLLAMSMLICCAQTSFAKRIVFANEGFSQVYALYLYRAQDNHTSANMLNGNTMYQGFGVTVDLVPLNGWDLIVDTNSGQRVTWNNIDFTHVNVMFLYPDRAEYQ